MTEQHKIHKRALIKGHMARRVKVIIVVVFLVISLLHLLRLFTGAEIVIAGTVIPVWTSLLGCVGPALLALLFWWSSFGGRETEMEEPCPVSSLSRPPTLQSSFQHNRETLMTDMQLTAIGRIETPYRIPEDCPRNVDNDGPPCRLVVDPALAPALLGLNVGQRILILYWFSGVDRQRLHQTSRKSGVFAGVFALRTPNRPNPVGAAVLTITAIAGNILTVPGLDCLDGTPLIDIKPAMGRE